VPRQLLGVEIKWADDFSTVHISIKKLIVVLLAQCGMLAAEPKDTPLEPGIQFSKKDLPTKDEVQQNKKFQLMQKKYRQVVGTFIFICGTCRPYIMYAVHVLCRSMANPSWKHYESAMHTLKYLSGTKDAGITYRSDGNTKPVTLADADNGSDETRRICAAFMAMLAAGLLLWAVTLVKELALSTCEAEVRAIGAAKQAIKSMLYMQKILKETVDVGLLQEGTDIDLQLKLSMPLVILEDNKGAIDWANKDISSKRMKHVENSLYWIRQYVKSNIIRLVHVKIEDQLADIGTKPLSKKLFQSIAQRIISYHI
jgi:hypothetical protein